MPKRALILSGSGMLTRCAELLVADGWRVVLPSRRYCPLPVRPSRPRESTAPAGKALWVEASWAEPRRLADGAARALDGPADLLIAWLHAIYRDAVLDAVAPLLADDAPVVEVYGCDSGDPADAVPEQWFPARPSQRVQLLFAAQGAAVRGLTHAEVTDGVAAAVRRAVAELPSSVHQIGERQQSAAMA
ncbi:hypothetical protein EV191_1117 [Tamaricihabitans halophyticus]|uniref:Short-chain dehydrogenase n=1 Tax=Tamaricihabitans halophyticus TaxID=1262583 RepID=A0A4R2QF99_9PSEU|nr:hypothetical protein [Tamaricihabitans halophyticus]TCP47803.1 hypothetical protein EV191_1117 [Tamaricihabitans halophyticus]